MARDDADEGDWRVATRQTNGRGRQGRAWSSPAGNLHASSLVRLRGGEPSAPTLALVAGVALHDAIGLAAASLKWPNDLLVGDAKLAGILLERTHDAVVIGFGVNVAYAPDVAGRPTCSLASLGSARTAPELIAPLAASLARWVAIWRDAGVAAIRDAWLARAHPVGTPLAVQDGGGCRLSGEFGGLADDCALLLRSPGGATRAINAGDVFVI